MPPLTRHLVALAAVVVVSAGAYANTLGYGAAWDDTRFVFASGATEGVAAIPSMFGRAMLDDMPAARGAYRPLTTSSYAVDWTLGRGQAAFFHKTNVLLHAVVSALVLVLLGRLGVGLAASVAGALLFAVHPVHVEAVANIAGRSELLVTLFALAAVIVYVGPHVPREAETSTPLPPSRAAAVFLLFALAMLSKEHGIALPVLLLAVEAFRAGSGSARERLLRRWPFWAGTAAVGAGYMAARRIALGTFTTVDVAPFIAVLPTWQRVTTAVANWTEYARLHLYPVDLAVDYGPAVVMPATPGDPRFWLGLGIAVAGLAVVVRARRARPAVALGIVWFAVVLLPTSNLLVPIAQWLAERFLYLPSVGFVVTVAALVDGRIGLAEGGRRRVGTAALTAILLLLGARTWSRNATWESTETVIATLIEEHPESFRSQWYLGRLHYEAGRTAEAFRALDSATALQPNAIELPLERAEWLLGLGRPAEARTVLEALPFGRHAVREAHLVRAFAAEGRVEEARQAIDRAREAFPANPVLAALDDSLTAAVPESR